MLQEQLHVQAMQPWEWSGCRRCFGGWGKAQEGVYSLCHPNVTSLAASSMFLGLISPVISHLSIVTLDQCPRDPWATFPLIPYTLPQHQQQVTGFSTTRRGQNPPLKELKGHWDGMRLLNLCLTPNNLIKQRLVKGYIPPSCFFSWKAHQVSEGWESNRHQKIY